MARLWVDLDRAAQIYIESSIAQHGDLELAREEAEEWLRIFNWVLAEAEDQVVRVADPDPQAVPPDWSERLGKLRAREEEADPLT